MSYEGQDDFIYLFPERRPSPDAYRQERTPERTSERTTEQKVRFMASVFLRFFGYPLAFVAALVTVITIFSFYGTYDHLANWPHAIAEVNSCEVDENEMAQSDPVMNKSFSYGFHCAVVYAPRKGSQSQLSNAVADIGYRTSNRGEMWVRWSNRIHRGDRVEIITDPSNPERANFAGEFSTAYAPPLHNLKYTLWFGLIAFVMLFLASKVRPANASESLS